MEPRCSSASQPREPYQACLCAQVCAGTSFVVPHQPPLGPAEHSVLHALMTLDHGAREASADELAERTEIDARALRAALEALELRVPPLVRHDEAAGTWAATRHAAG